MNKQIRLPVNGVIKF